MFGRDPRHPSELEIKETEKKETAKNTTAAEEIMNRMREVYKRASKKLEEAARTQKKYYDERRDANNFREGDIVWLKVDRPEAEGVKLKLGKRWRGPYQIRQMHKLNATIRHANNPLDKQLVTIQRLKRAWLRVGEKVVCAYTPEEAKEREETEKEEIEIAKNRAKRKEKGEAEYEIEEILDAKGKGKRKMYLVRWVGYPPSQDQWVHTDGVNAERLVAEFKQRRRKRET